MATFRKRQGAPRARVKVDPETGMNRLEAAYAAHLEARRLGGEIAAFRFERVTFRLASRCRYTPDFEVVLADGGLEYHEVKGHWMEDARVKIKMAANLFRDRAFVAVRRPRSKDPWGFELIQPDKV